ncbi:MAG: hypothetical protein AB1422_13595 [bacterium]
MKYLIKLANIKVGLLINFNVERLKKDRKRFVLSNLRDLRALRGKIIGEILGSNRECGMHNNSVRQRKREKTAN